MSRSEPNDPASTPAAFRHQNLRSFILWRQVVLWLLLLVIGVSVYWGINHHATNARAVSVTQREQLLVENTLRAVSDMQSSIRGYAITGREEYLAPYNRVSARLPSQFDELRRLVRFRSDADLQGNLEDIGEVERMVRDYRSLLAERVLVIRPRSREAALRLIDSNLGQTLTDAVRAQLAAYETGLGVRQEQYMRDTAAALAQVQLITITSLLAALVVSFLTSSSIAGLLAAVFGRMAHASRLLAEGQLDQPVQRSALTEADALAGNFNTMASSLRAAHDSLQLRHRELERAHDELRRLNTFNALLLESAGEGILGVDRQGRFTFTNQVARELTGYDDQELLGQHHHLLTHPGLRADERGEPGECPVCTSMSEGAIQENQSDAFFRKDRTSFSVEFVSAPLRDEHDEVIGAVVMFRDITARKQAEAELYRSNRELEQIAFVASHDLQSPLRTVASFTDLLGSRYASRLDDQAHQYMSMISLAVARMKRLIDDLLAFSSLRQDVELAMVSAEAAFAEALNVLGSDIEASGAQITADPLPEVWSEQTQLTLVFENLLRNALRYARPGVAPRVHVTAAEQPGMARFAVRDNGIGVKEQHFERIFRLFQRLHHDEQIPGSGMGLTLCQSIVERQGGQIWLESTPGEGSTFYFTLQAAPPAGRRG